MRARLDLSAGGIRKKDIGIRSWLVVTTTGQTQMVEAGNHAIMRRTGLPAQCLRILDPLLSYPSTVMPSERAIVINLEYIKAIITAQEALLLNHHSVTSLVEEILRRILRQRHQAQEGDDNNSNRKELSHTREVRPQESTNGIKSLPFEFVALEACLEAACSALENEANTLEHEARPVIEKLTSKITTLNLEHVRQIKTRLVALTGRVQKVRDELEHLLDGDKDMAEMYLTDKLDQQLENYSTSCFNTTSAKQNVQDLEMLLEPYFVQINGTLNELSMLREVVRDIEEHINIMLDDKQNQLLQMIALFNTATMVVSAFVVVSGIFGMNVDNELFDTENPVNYEYFFWIAATCIFGPVFLYVFAWSLYKHKRLLA